MATLEPHITDVASTRDGTRIAYGEWPGAEPVLVFCHGLTSSHRNAAATARALDGAVRVVSLDLRGRGNSDHPPAGSYGIAQHGRDVVDVLDALGIERAVLGGHSMGAYVATMAATLAPERVAGLVLVDGGVLMVPEGAPDVDPDVLAETVIGPVLARLRATYPSVDAYVDTWRAMPYFQGDGWSDIVEDYARYDCGHRGADYAAKCSETAAMEDWRNLLTDVSLRTLQTGVRCPVLGIGAEHGMVEGQPSVLSEAHADHLRTMVADVEFVLVPGTSHHTVTLSEAGARACAEAVRKFVARLS